MTVTLGFGDHFNKPLTNLNYFGINKNLETASTSLIASIQCAHNVS